MKELYKHIMTNHTKEELKQFGIYAIKNTINDKMYIGSTRASFYDRWSQHMQQFEKNEHSNKYMQNSWNKYGYKNFQFKIIYIANKQSDVDNIINIEQKYIDDFKTMIPNGYNIMPADFKISRKRLRHLNDHKRILKENKKDSLLLKKYIPNESIFYKIRDMFCIQNESKYFICNLFNIDVDLFEYIISDNNYIDMINNYNFKNYIDIYKLKRPSFSEDTRLMYSRKKCYDCIFYRVKGDKCNYFNIYMPNNHVIDCKYAIQDTVFDKECVSENDLEYDIDDLKIYYQEEKIDDIIEKYLDGGYFG